MSRVGWIDSHVFDAHDNGPGHPEQPARLIAIRERLEAQGVAARLERTAPGPVEAELLTRIHDPLYVALVEKVASRGGGYLDAETSVGPASWEAARLAAGGVVEATLKVVDGSWQRALCTVRPPGHHARPSMGMGFCLFDNVAVAAEAARQAGVERVAILDWDVHHGNGTQEIFYSRADVLYASWHQYPFYPGTGARDETGVGEGEGKTVNCPLAAGSGDAEYLASWRDRILPALERFEPGLVLISAGFDADSRDPMGDLVVSPAGFEQLSAEVVRWADAHCQGRVVSVLEGGYDLDALAEDVALHAETLL